MNFKILKPLSIFTLCLGAFVTPVFAAEKVLQSLDNLEEYHTHEGNYFKLIRLDKGCRIEVGFYKLTDQEFENYVFKNNELISANKKTYNYLYEKDEELSLEHVTDTILYSTEYFNIQHHSVQRQFKEYKALFPTKYLKQCI